MKLNTTKMKLFFASVMALLMLACGSKKGGENISGTITGADGKELVLEQIKSNQPVPVDTVKLDKSGKFGFKLPSGKIDFYRLRLDNSIIIVCVDSTEHAVVTADAKSLNDSYRVTGSKNSEVICEFYNGINKISKDRMALEQQMKGMNFADTAKAMALQSQMEQVIQRMSSFTKGIVDKYPNSPSLVVVQGLLNPMEDFEYFKKIEKAVAGTMPNSIYHSQISATIQQIQYQMDQMKSQKSLEVGMPMPEIKLANPQGKEIALSSLKGKVVLVDFWASWCGPCRAENPNVVATYDKWHAKGFEVFSVSLDLDKQKWTDAIAKDGLKWPYHVSDLLQWQSIVVKEFGIQSIPFALLLDRQGNIAAKGLRGPALEAKVKELINAQ